jgi:hypothetical protein
MSLDDILATLARRGWNLITDDGRRLIFTNCPQPVLTEDLVEALNRRRPELLQKLERVSSWEAA